MPSPVLTAYSDLGTEPDIILEAGDAGETLDISILQEFGFGANDGAHIIPAL